MEARDELERLKAIIVAKNREIEQLKQASKFLEPVVSQNSEQMTVNSGMINKLSNAEISRYSRQLILPELGVKGQLSLRNKSVLIVGAGGLGCPAAIYLAAAGIGTLGIVDYDEVELSNLHRQVLHRESRVGVCKSVSAATSCQELNSFVKYVPYHLQLDSSNALQIIQQYDIILDATDNVATRYLLNDTCVLAEKPLVSGSALRFEGQLTVYNYNGGPCYRCLYPKPPPPETVTNCSDGGVLGVIPGIIGCLQALEAIKIAAGLDSSYSQKLLMYDGLDGMFRNIKLRGRQPNCPVCGDNPSIKHLIDYEQFCGARASDKVGLVRMFRNIKLRGRQPICPVCGDNPSIKHLIDYEQFCGARASDKDKDLSILPPEERISVERYKEMLDSNSPHLLVDVRTPVELDICQLPNDAINVPVSDLHKSESVEHIREKVSTITNTNKDDPSIPVVFVCRRGNDSQIAVNRLKEKLKDEAVTLMDISGGLTSWAKKIDPDFPTY